MSTELFRHLGMFENDLHFAALVNCLKFLFFLNLMLQYLIVYHLVSLISFTAKPLFPEATNGIKRAVSAGFWELCFQYLKLNKVSFNVTGDTLDSEPAVIISNHQSIADYIAISHLATTAASEQLMIPQINYFSWFSLWRVPTFRIFKNLAKSDENWELDEEYSKALFKPVLESNLPEWIALFPEVNIWTQENATLNLRQCEKYFLPVMENVLYPRFSGLYNVMTALDSIPNKFTRLYSITITYSTLAGDEPFGEIERGASPSFKAPNLVEFFTMTTPLNVNIQIKSKLLSRIPVKRKKLEKWLEKHWVEKDKSISILKIAYDDQISTYSTTGNFKSSFE